MASAYAAPNDAAIRDAAIAAESEAYFGAPVVSAVPPRISWSAVLAGIVLAVAIEVLLGVLGAGIGFATIQPGSPSSPDASTMATSAGLWSLGTTLFALVIGGWAAARLAGVTSRKDGMLHGLMIWAVAVLLTVYLMTAAVGGALSLVGGLANSASGGLRAMAPQLSGMSADAMGQEARGLLQPNAGGDLSGMSGDDAQKEVTHLLPDLAAGGDRASQARGRIVDIMSVQLKISHDDAAKRLDDARAKLSQSAQSAASTGADMAAHAALIGFGGLLAGAVAAGLGGLMARPRLIRRTNRLR